MKILENSLKVLKNHIRNIRPSGQPGKCSLFDTLESGEAIGYKPVLSAASAVGRVYRVYFADETNGSAAAEGI